MALDDIFDQNLKDYVISTTSDESALLENLRKETSNATEFSRMLSGPVEGKLLQFLVKISGAKKCLEIGTFTGYSALNIASSLPEAGKLITCEIRQEYADIAQKYFDLSEYGHKIEIRLGEATQTITALNDTYDFIFIDADKGNYPVYYDMLIPKLHPQGLMVVDNALWNGKVVAPKDAQSLAIHALNMKARNDSRVETVMLTVRDGILLIRKL